MQPLDASSPKGRSAAGQADLDSHSLMDTFLTRRSRRFALGNDLQGGGLSYTSERNPVPLSIDEEAVLAFAASGVTGHVNGELPYVPAAGPETGGGRRQSAQRRRRADCWRRPAQDRRTNGC